jgi:hypothetical protein
MHLPGHTDLVGIKTVDGIGGKELDIIEVDSPIAVDKDCEVRRLQALEAAKR